MTPQPQHRADTLAEQARTALSFIEYRMEDDTDREWFAKIHATVSELVALARAEADIERLREAVEQAERERDAADAWTLEVERRREAEVAQITRWHDSWKRLAEQRAVERDQFRHALKDELDAALAGGQADPAPTGPGYDRCDHGCGREATVLHADGRVLCKVCYLTESRVAPGLSGCPTCAPDFGSPLGGQADKEPTT